VITHYLPVPQPTAWAVLSGKLEAVNYTLRPPESLLGKRVGVWGEALDPAWWVLEGWGFQLPREAGGLGENARATGWLGTVELVGWLFKPGAKVEAQGRGDGKTTAISTRKGVVGPVAWILRKPKWGEEWPGAKRIRPNAWETQDYRQRVLCYAQKHGHAGLSDHHHQILIEMGYAPEKADTHG